jgi:leukotriene A-4 hydrolase/aminopeptidase
MLKRDPHSCWEPGAAQIAHIDFHLDVNFDKRTLSGWADYRFTQPIGAVLKLDTNEIAIEEVVSVQEPTRVMKWTFSESSFKGREMAITGAEGLSKLRIVFASSPEAAALQWMDPAQTADKRHPYMYSQCQSILARSVFPCQDTPAVRFTYTAAIRVPGGMTAVMAATQQEVTLEEGGTVCHFHMRHPIPSYLFAIAVGDIVAEPIGLRSRVCAEPSIVKGAAWEFAEVDRMIEGASGLFGEYIWDRFDLLVMPPSFPFGGMENPTLTFLTPTLIAGDRSLVSVVAHELAHSWTGNLVTNATWEDFWLNEGWTVYAERRIVERLYGTELANLQAVNGRNDLLEAFKNFKTTPEFTKLKNDLEGVDPDEVFSTVPYEKGFLLLVAIEKVVGREIFDKFIRKYIETFAFTSITTLDFLDFLNKELPTVKDKVDLHRWIYEPGLPDDAPVFKSSMIDEVRKLRERWDTGDRDLKSAIAAWNVDQKTLFLDELKMPLSQTDCEILEYMFDTETTKNSEILLLWFRIAIESSYAKAYPAIREFLGIVGRGKYLKPLYRAMHANLSTREMAKQMFEEFKDRYHSMGRAAVSRILAG